MTITNFADIKTETGKTIRQENMEQQCNIPVGALVEIVLTGCEVDDPENGMRLLVVAHQRDCDGTPLYMLSHKPDAYKLYTEAKDNIENEMYLNYPEEEQSFMRSVMVMNYQQANGALLSGYSEETLKLIREPK